MFCIESQPKTASTGRLAQKTGCTTCKSGCPRPCQGLIRCGLTATLWQKNEQENILQVIQNISSKKVLGFFFFNIIFTTICIHSARAQHSLSKVRAYSNLRISSLNIYLWLAHMRALAYSFKKTCSDLYSLFQPLNLDEQKQVGTCSHAVFFFHFFVCHQCQWTVLMIHHRCMAALEDRGEFKMHCCFFH